MGFLDHSTNNIIIDAVLTDVGRSKLADNNGSFQIRFFALADDEVDYSLIKKFGRTVGKEKITKNTPIFEAQTASSYALKHRLLTLPDSTVTRLPRFTLTGGGTNLENNVLRFSRTSSRTVEVVQQIDGQSVIPDGTADVSFSIFVPDRFLYVNGSPSLEVSTINRVATYNKFKDTSNTGALGSSVTIQLTTQQIDDTLFNVYGDGTTIKSVVTVLGDQSGLRKDFQVSITST